MNINDISGLGKAVQALPKLLDSIKGFFVLGSAFSRANRFIDKIIDNHLDVESMTFKTPSLEVKIDGVKSSKENSYLTRTLKTKGDQFIR